MQMSNTAKHILSRGGDRVQFSQQCATTFETPAMMFQQVFHRTNDRSRGPHSAAQWSDSRRNPAERHTAGEVSGDLGAVVIPGLLEETGGAELLPARGLLLIAEH